MASGERYNESADTFSFSLVLLCIAVGDMKHLQRSAGKFFSMAAFASGWRPPIPQGISQHSPDLSSLVSSMWQTDFRQRPRMADVVTALEDCTSLLGDLDRADTKIVPRLTECKSMNGFALTADEQFALPLAALKHFLGSSGQLAFSNDATHTCHPCVFIVTETSSATAY